MRRNSCSIDPVLNAVRVDVIERFIQIVAGRGRYILLDVRLNKRLRMKVNVLIDRHRLDIWCEGERIIRGSRLGWRELFLSLLCVRGLQQDWLKLSMLNALPKIDHVLFFFTDRSTHTIVFLVAVKGLVRGQSCSLNACMLFSRAKITIFLEFYILTWDHAIVWETVLISVLSTLLISCRRVASRLPLELVLIGGGRARDERIQRLGWVDTKRRRSLVFCKLLLEQVKLWIEGRLFFFYAPSMAHDRCDVHWLWKLILEVALIILVNFKRLSMCVVHWIDWISVGWRFSVHFI